MEVNINPEEFFDINRFPKGWGIIIFPISMSRISNSQSAEAYIEHLRLLGEKVVEPRVGINFLYTEGLYMNMPGNAFDMKNSYGASTISHANSMRRLIKKYHNEFQIHDAFNFESWFQMYLSHPNFLNAWRQIKNFYDADDKFKELIAEDAGEAEKELDEYQTSFYLEEYTFVYLLLNGQMKIRNDFVQGRESWILLAYPGTPPKAQAYLAQKDPLNIGSHHNPFKGEYDLLKRKFIDHTKINFND